MALMWEWGRENEDSMEKNRSWETHKASVNRLHFSYRGFMKIIKDSLLSKSHSCWIVSCLESKAC